MGIDDDGQGPQKNSNPLEKWSHQATTSAFGLMESLRGQSSSIAKNLKIFGKSLIKEDRSGASRSPPTPPEHRDDDIRMTWLTNRIVLADTLHKSKEGLLQAEKAVVREMIDCQPYVVVNVHAEPLRLDGYAKSIHVPLGVGSKGGLPHQPLICNLIPILNEYCLLTNDAAIVIFGADENVVITAAFCLIASLTIGNVVEFLRESLATRFDRLPTTYKQFLEQTREFVKLCCIDRKPSIGFNLQHLILEPGNVIIEGEIYVAVSHGSNQIKVFEYSANQCRNEHGQIVFTLSSHEVLDDVVVFIGQKGNIKPLLVARFNTQLVDSADTDIVISSSEMDISRIVPQPVQDLRMIVNFATRRIPTINSFQFDRYKLLCVRNERELEGYQRSYGFVDTEELITSKPKNNRRTEDSRKVDQDRNGGAAFFDSLNFGDDVRSQAQQREERLLDDDSDGTADLLSGFTLKEPATDSASRNDFSLGHQPSQNFVPTETPILSAPTPQTSEYDQSSVSATMSQKSGRGVSPTPAIDDLLGLGSTSSTSNDNFTSSSIPTSTSQSANNLADFDFGPPIQPTNKFSSTTSATSTSSQMNTNAWSNNDLLGGFSPLKPTQTATPPNSMTSSAANSKPVSAVNSNSDFEAFLSNYPEQNRSSPITTGSVPTTQTKPAAAKQSYKPAFGDPTPSSAKVSSDAFSDLMGGFMPTTRDSKNKSIGSLLKAEQAKNLTPEEIKIRDWTQGKERNIRALLGSLNSVLWEGADKWNQPSMADLLTPDQIKKQYRKACLVVHPDKLTGSPHLNLAKAVFTELNDAYNKYTNDPSS